MASGLVTKGAPKRKVAKPTPAKVVPAAPAEQPVETAVEEADEVESEDDVELGQEPRRSSRLQQAADAPPMPGCVIYLGHIPHGFYENEMRGFFSQFGKVRRLRLARNKKTTKSKHYAYLEFVHAEVAPIAAEAMNNYLMFQKILKCHVVPNKDLHADMFKGADKKFRQKPWKAIERERHNQTRTPEQETKRLEKLKKRDEQRRAKLQAAGIEYEYEGYDTVETAAASHTKFED